jgi:RES domain-containing protein
MPREAPIGWEDVDPVLTICVEQVSFRATRLGHNPLLLQEACAWQGRYHAYGDPQPLYASLDKQTAEAELGRTLERYGVRSADATVEICELTFSGRALDIADENGQSGLRLVRDDLIADDVELCRDIARLARSLGVDGIICPSAARLEGTNLIVLHESVATTVKPVRVEV